MKKEIVIAAGVAAVAALAGSLAVASPASAAE